MGLREPGRSWGARGTQQRSAQGQILQTWGQTHWIPPRFPLLHHSLRVGPLTRRAPGHPLPTEEPWEHPRSGDISGTVHRWVPAAVGAWG